MHPYIEVIGKGIATANVCLERVSQAMVQNLHAEVGRRCKQLHPQSLKATWLSTLKPLNLRVHTVLSI